MRKIALVLSAIILLAGCGPSVEKVVPDRASVGNVIDLRDPIHKSLGAQGVVHFGPVEGAIVLNWGPEDVFVQVPAGLTGDVSVYVEIYELRSNTIELSILESSPLLRIMCFGDSIFYLGVPETLQILLDQHPDLGRLNPVVMNQGRSAEPVSRDATWTRWSNALDYYDLDVAVLLEGTNDVSDEPGVSMADIQQSVMRLIDEGMLRGMDLVLCTLLPRVGACGDAESPTTEEFNGWLASYARGRGIPLVDVYEGFVSTLGWEQIYFDADCMHPNGQGKERIGELLRDKMEEMYLTP